MRNRIAVLICAVALVAACAGRPLYTFDRFVDNYDIALNQLIALRADGVLSPGQEETAKDITRGIDAAVAMWEAALRSGEDPGKWIDAALAGLGKLDEFIVEVGR